MFRFAGWHKKDYQTTCGAPNPAKDKGRKGTKLCDSPEIFPEDCPLRKEFVIRFGENAWQKEAQVSTFRKEPK